jgi:hypothetical protein
MRIFLQTTTNGVMVPWIQRRTEQSFRRDLTGIVVVGTRCLKDVRLDNMSLEGSSRKDVD